MIAEPVLALADWLRDPDTGINAYLPGLALEAADEELALVPIVRVLDPFRDEEAFANTEPGAYPALVVTPAGPVDVEGEVNQNEQNGESTQLSVRLIQDDIQSPRAIVANSYYMTALNRAISGFFADSAAGSAARQRGHVHIIACLKRSYALAYEAMGNAKTAGAMVLTLSTRDIEAT